MKKLLFVALMLLACQKHDDSGSITKESTSATTTSAATATTASASPLATIDPSATATASAPAATESASAARDAGTSAADARRAALQKQADDMQLQVLGVLGGTPNALSSGRPHADLSTVSSRDAGTLQFGSGHTPPVGGPGGGGFGSSAAHNH